MPEPEKKIIVDDDWKAEAQREKERLAQQEEAAQELPDPSFPELLNMIVMQAVAGMGLMATPDGQRMPPNLPIAKHFIDMLQVLEDKTKGNLTDEEKRLLDQVLYEMRMTFVQVAGAGGVPGSGVRPTAVPSPLDPA
ncbi:MAG: DUF1844 domain-containing protein [Phycisphaerales bacterium]|nr:DUF1844 domain-containing protein [Phycisphaerales bacterium]